MSQPLPADLTTLPPNAIVVLRQIPAHVLPALPPGALQIPPIFHLTQNVPVPRLIAPTHLVDYRGGVPYRSDFRTGVHQLQDNLNNFVDRVNRLEVSGHRFVAPTDANLADHILHLTVTSLWHERKKVVYAILVQLVRFYMQHCALPGDEFPGGHIHRFIQYETSRCYLVICYAAHLAGHGLQSTVTSVTPPFTDGRGPGRIGAPQVNVNSEDAIEFIEYFFSHHADCIPHGLLQILKPTGACTVNYWSSLDQLRNKMKAGVNGGIWSCAYVTQRQFGSAAAISLANGGLFYRQFLFWKALIDDIDMYRHRHDPTGSIINTFSISRAEGEFLRDHFPNLTSVVPHNLV